MILDPETSAGSLSDLAAGNLKKNESVAMIGGKEETVVDDFANLQAEGVAAFRAGDAQSAVGLLGRASALRPDDVETLAGLGGALVAAGRREEGFAVLEQALSIDATSFSARSNLGVARRLVGDHAGAQVEFERAVEQAPGNVAALLNQARGLHTLGRLKEAATVLRQVVALAPDHARAWRMLAHTLLSLERYEEALTAARRIISLAPQHADTYWILGQVSQKTGRWRAAENAYRLAVALSPQDPVLIHGLGMALARIGQEAEAEETFRRCLHLQPDFPEAMANLAGLLGLAGKDEEVIALCRRALEISPGYATARYNLALALLRNGCFQEGWAAYEARLQASANSRLPDHPAPFWEGESIAGKTVIVLPEQGLGDQIQCARYAPLLRAQGARVVLAVAPPLERLLREANCADEVVGQGPLPAADFKLPLMSLPYRFGCHESTIPFPEGYLPRPRVTTMAGKVPLRVGIAWQGDPNHYNDRNRSVPLAYFEALAIPGVELVSLQVGPAAAAVARHPFVRASEIPLRDFADTATALAGLDLVICVDTSVAHLAGAMGRQVWLLLPEPCDWRWLRGRDDSPWYASMQLFRQPRPRDWSAVFATLRHELISLMGTQ